MPATVHNLSYFIPCELAPFPQPSTYSPRRIWPSPQISHLVYMSTWLIPLWQAALPETIAPDVDWWTLSGQNNAACWGLELCASDLIVLLNVMTMSLSSLGFVVWIAITLSELWEQNRTCWVMDRNCVNKLKIKVTQTNKSKIQFSQLLHSWVQY